MKRNGFTVLELLVVIGIIGVLMAVLLSSMGGASDSARAAKCLANLHCLAAGVSAVGMAENFYPAAGSYERRTYQGTSANYSEIKGWVSWASMNAYGTKQTAHRSSAGWFASTYVKDVDVRTYCLTNGALWRAVNANAAVYVCPLHGKYAAKKNVSPVWSYVMNSTFGWDESQGSTPRLIRGHRFDSLTRGDRRLLFAELPFNTDNKSQTCSFSTSAGLALDPTLQYPAKNSSFKETIGFNHKEGKKWYAHVCFADGHTEKLELPKGAGEAATRELTKWLCEGSDVTYNGSHYEELK